MQYIPVGALAKASLWPAKDYDLGNGQKVTIYEKGNMFTFGPVIKIADFRRWFNTVGNLDVMPDEENTEADDSANPEEAAEQQGQPMEVEDEVHLAEPASNGASEPTEYVPEKPITEDLIEQESTPSVEDLPIAIQEPAVQISKLQMPVLGICSEPAWQEPIVPEPQPEVAEEEEESISLFDMMDEFDNF